MAWDSTSRYYYRSVRTAAGPRRVYIGAGLLGELAARQDDEERAQRAGLCTPDAVRMATEEYRTDSDIIGRFLAECTKPSADSIGALALYKVYKAWAENEGHKPMSNTAFGRKLAERGIERVHTIVGRQYARLEMTQSAADFA